MALFKKPAKTIKEVIAEHSAFEEDDIPPEESEVRAMEEPWDDEDQAPLRRKVAAAVVGREFDEVFEGDGDDTPPQWRLPLKPVVTATKKPTIRVSADINQELHHRLKIHAAITKQSIIQIFEDWITKYTPA